MDPKVKPHKKKRDKQLQFYVSVEEDEQLQWAANEIGITKSSYIRMVALKAAKAVIS